MTIEKDILLKSPAGRPFLADVYYVADGVAKSVVVFLHGFKGFKDWGCWHLFAEAFAAAGLVFVKFNFSHNGVTTDRPSEFADLEAFGHNTYTKELVDLRQVMDWLTHGRSPVPEAEMDANRLGLIGHSRGGGIALVYAAQDDRVKAVATLAGVSDLAFMWEGNPKLEDWKKQGVTYLHNARTGQEMPVYLDLFEDYNAHQPWLNVEYAIQHLRAPCLIVHGDADASVPVQAAMQIHHWNPASKLTIIEGADHVFGAAHPCAGRHLPEHCLRCLEAGISFFTEKLAKAPSN